MLEISYNAGYAKKREPPVDPLFIFVSEL